MSRTKSILFILAVVFAAVTADAAEKRQAAGTRKPAAPRQMRAIPKAKGNISVFGTASPTEEQYTLARYVGYFAARRGYIVLNGGKGGVMEAVSKGAKQGRGFVIGVMPDASRGRSNRYVDYEFPTGLGALRNTVLASAGDGAIAIGKTPGTTSEVGWALRLGKPVVAPKGHVQSFDGVNMVKFPRGTSEFMRLAVTARDMVDALIKDMGKETKAKPTKSKGGPLKDPG